MKNKFSYGELVKVTGIGKIYGKVKEKLGFVIEKDKYFNDYYIDLIFSNKDWFNETEISKVFEKTKCKSCKYQVRLCTTKQGYEILNGKLKDNQNISNNKFKKVKIYKKFRKDNKEYIVIGWNSVYWPVSNKSVKIIEDTLEHFKNTDIPFKYIVMNENKITDIKILEFTEIDNNVDIIFVERKIKITNPNKN